MQRFRAENPDLVRERAKVALEYCKSHTRCELECKGIPVKVHLTDTVDEVVDRWRVAYNFFGLSIEDRRLIYHLYIENEMTMIKIQQTSGLNEHAVELYIRQKGWSRTFQELREQQTNPKNKSLQDRMNSWDFKRNASWVARQNGVDEPYVYR